MKHHRVLRIVTKLLIPYILLFALYVQFHGDFGPGGGFQAGVIFASAFILYGLVFGLENAKLVAPPAVIERFVGIGLALYALTGFAGIALGGEFLNYFVLAADPQAGQHYGILIVELGVGITVAATMITIFYYFSGRAPGED